MTETKKEPAVCTCSTGSPQTCRRHRYLYSPSQGAYDDDVKPADEQ